MTASSRKAVFAIVPCTVIWVATAPLWDWNEVPLKTESLRTGLLEVFCMVALGGGLGSEDRRSRARFPRLRGVEWRPGFRGGWRGRGGLAQRRAPSQRINGESNATGSVVSSGSP